MLLIVNFALHAAMIFYSFTTFNARVLCFAGRGIFFSTTSLIRASLLTASPFCFRWPTPVQTQTVAKSSSYGYTVGLTGCACANGVRKDWYEDWHHHHHRRRQNHDHHRRHHTLTAALATAALAAAALTAAAASPLATALTAAALTAASPATRSSASAASTSPSSDAVRLLFPSWCILELPLV